MNLKFRIKIRGQTGYPVSDALQDNNVQGYSEIKLKFQFGNFKKIK